MPGLFEYLITPECQEQQIIIAITTANDTITAYSRTPQNSKESQNQDNCFINYFRQKQDFHFIQAKNSSHKKMHKYMHSSQKEKEVNHTHFKHKKQIEIKTLNQFLKHLASHCPSNSGIYLTHKVRKDIIRKYKEHYTKNLGKIKPLNTLTSNSIFYKNPQFYNTSLPENIHLPENTIMPTIPQHAACLNEQNAIGCLRIPQPLPNPPLEFLLR